MTPRLRAFLVCFVLAGCQAGTGTNTRLVAVAPLPSPGAVYAAARAGAPLLPGQVSGYVARWDGQAFAPAAGVEVRLGSQPARATTDARGYYGFAHVPPGLLTLEIDTAGDHPARLACRLPGMTGLARVNLALVPKARPASLAGDAVALAGVAVDPRGAALPGATVRVVDSLSKEGNRAVTADADGFWAAVVPGVPAGPLADGIATLTAFGTTPGGVRVESTDALNLQFGPEPTIAVTAATRVFAAPKALRWAEANDKRRILVGENLPSRRDELVLRFARELGYTEGLPASSEPGRIAVDMPPGSAAGVTVELLPLGLLPPEGKPPGIPLDQPVRASAAP